MKLIFAVVALANAYVIRASAFGRRFSEHEVALNPVVFVMESTGISNASQYWIKSAAFSHPCAVNAASNSSVLFPFSSCITVAFATAPTVIPFNLMNPVTISFA